MSIEAKLTGSLLGYLLLLWLAWRALCWLLRPPRG
jgi:hypothetical protein